jgi:hypothetical protein
VAPPFFSTSAPFECNPVSFPPAAAVAAAAAAAAAAVAVATADCLPTVYPSTFLPAVAVLARDTLDELGARVTPAASSAAAVPVVGGKVPGNVGGGVGADVGDGGVGSEVGSAGANAANFQYMP